ncbi:hypothetical protein RA8CHR_02833 [Variovorax sp. RA8]|nr:hypothetical protein RA8CHR_02833 [Variovorax sp. RA8]
MDFGIFILMQLRNKHKASHQILRGAVLRAATRARCRLRSGAEHDRPAPRPPPNA